MSNPEDEALDRVSDAGLIASRQSFWRRHRTKVLASAGLIALFVWILHAGGLPLVPAREGFRSVRWAGVAAFFLLWVAVYLVRCARWYWLVVPIHRLPFAEVFKASLIGIAAVLVMPFRTGEVVRPMLIRRSGKLSAWAATGSVAAERAIDGLTLSIILFTALAVAEPLSPLPDRIAELPIPTALVPRAARIALGVFFAAFAVMAVFYRWREIAVRITLRIFSPISERFARWACDGVDKVAQGLRFLPQRRFTGPFLIFTLLYWSGNMASTWLLGWACGFETFTFAQACVVVGVIGLGISLPSAPGFFGAYQISMYAALAMFFAPSRIVSEGSVFVFLQYVLQVAVQLGLGVIALFMGGRR